MSVNEIQALAQRFADGFDKWDVKTVLEMLSDDVEVIDHVPIDSTARQPSPNTSMNWGKVYRPPVSAFVSRPAGCTTTPSGL